MAKPIDTFHEYVMGDVLGHISGVTSKKMFGGYGIYFDGFICGMITGDGELRLKANDESKGQFERRGGQQFVSTGHKNKKPTAMPYWSVAEEVMEDRDMIEQWVRRSAELSRTA